MAFAVLFGEGFQDDVCCWIEEHARERCEEIAVEVAERDHQACEAKGCGQGAGEIGFQRDDAFVAFRWDVSRDEVSGFLQCVGEDVDGEHAPAERGEGDDFTSRAAGEVDHERLGRQVLEAIQQEFVGLPEAEPLGRFSRWKRLGIAPERLAAVLDEPSEGLFGIGLAPGKFDGLAGRGELVNSRWKLG